MNMTRLTGPLLMGVLILGVWVGTARGDNVALVDPSYNPEAFGESLGPWSATAGWEFSPSIDIHVTQLGFYD